jgi:hypothetical protein
MTIRDILKNINILNIKILKTKHLFFFKKNQQPPLVPRDSHAICKLGQLQGSLNLLFFFFFFGKDEITCPIVIPA